MFRIKKRAAISSIVGSFFFLVLMFAAFGAILAAFQFQSELVNINKETSNAEVKRIQENFSIKPFTGGGNLHVWINNTGTNSIEVADMWVIKDDGSSTNFYPITSQQSFVPSGSAIDIFSSGPAIPLDATGYTIKAVTSLGNIVIGKLPIGSATPLDEADPLQDNLVARPAVYAAFPSPFSGTTGNGYFALIIANPTNHPFWVNRTSFQVISPTNPQMFSTGGVVADSGGWTSFPPTNQWSTDSFTLTWTSSAAVKIDPYGLKAFQVRVTPHGSIKDSNINTINTNSFTTFGQFGTQKIDTIASLQSAYAVPNIFQKDGNGKVIYVVEKRVASTSTIYNVTMKNTSGGTGQDKGVIKAGAKIIINIPKDFEIEESKSSSSSSNIQLVDASDIATDSYITLWDQSKQIRARVTSDLTANGEATLAFKAKAPSVTGIKLYPFYIFGNGNVTDAVSGNIQTRLMGPIAETIVQVCPTSTC